MQHEVSQAKLVQSKSPPPFPNNHPSPAPAIRAAAPGTTTVRRAVGEAARQRGGTFTLMPSCNRLCSDSLDGGGVAVWQPRRKPPMTKDPLAVIRPLVIILRDGPVSAEFYEVRPGAHCHGCHRTRSLALCIGRPGQLSTLSDKHQPLTLALSSQSCQ